MILSEIESTIISDLSSIEHDALNHFFKKKNISNDSLQIQYQIGTKSSQTED